MATKYVEEFATEADFLARAPDRSNKLGIGSVSEVLLINRAAAVVEVVDESRAQTLTNKTLTAPVITDATEVLAATEVLVAADSGKVLYLNHATEFQTTLPALAAGLRFTFIVQAAPSGADYTIFSSDGANIIKGQVYTTDVNSVTDPDFEASGGDTISFVTAKSIAGDKVDLYCDGTNWFAYCFCSLFDAITITTAA